jgi:hypothetical protein
MLWTNPKVDIHFAMILSILLYALSSKMVFYEDGSGSLRHKGVKESFIDDP